MKTLSSHTATFFKILVCLVLSFNLLGAEGGCGGAEEEPGPDKECVADAECNDGFVCNDEGQCVEENATCACPAVYAPVCGEDGQTYGNSCEAECANVAVASEGECEVACPALGCNPYCEYGVRVDANGCDTCECNPAPDDACFSDNDCSNGQICSWGETSSSGGGPTPPPIPACPDEDGNGVCDFDEDQPAGGRCIDPPSNGCQSDADCAPNEMCSWGEENRPGGGAEAPCMDENGDGQCDDGRPDEDPAPSEGSCVPRNEMCFSDEDCGRGERCSWGEGTEPGPPPIQCADMDGDGECDGAEDPLPPGYCVPDVNECFSDFDCAPNEHCVYDQPEAPAPCTDEDGDGMCDEEGRRAPVGYCALDIRECNSDAQCDAGEFCNFHEPPPIACLDEDGDGVCDGADEPAPFGWCDSNEACACPAVWDPVCGVNGETYGNWCEAECDRVDVAYEGECGGSCICTEEYAPVCGEDGETYSNACHAECGDVAIAYEGECRGDECEPVLCDLWCEFGFQTDPETGCEICACNEAPEGFCNSDADCARGETCLPAQDCFAPDCPGECVPENNECICTEEYAPVCGEDGETYGNACHAECGNVAIAYEGECR